MGHIQRARRKLTARINRLIGQLEAAKAMISDDSEEEERCYEVMRQLASIRGAHRGLMNAYFTGFVEDHMKSAAKNGTIDEFADELLEVLRSFQQ